MQYNIKDVVECSISAVSEGDDDSLIKYYQDIVESKREKNIAAICLLLRNGQVLWSNLMEMFGESQTLDIIAQIKELTEQLSFETVYQHFLKLEELSAEAVEAALRKSDQFITLLGDSFNSVRDSVIQSMGDLALMYEELNLTQALRDALTSSECEKYSFAENRVRTAVNLVDDLDVTLEDKIRRLQKGEEMRLKDNLFGTKKTLESGIEGLAKDPDALINETMLEKLRPCLLGKQENLKDSLKDSLLDLL